MKKHELALKLIRQAIKIHESNAKQYKDYVPDSKEEQRVQTECADSLKQSVKVLESDA